MPPISLLKTLTAQIILLPTALTSFIPTISTLGPTASNHSVSASYTYTPSTLDGPHLSALNSSVYEWWYFDAVTPDLSTALVLTFFATTPAAFPLVGPVPSDLSVFVWATLPNGSTIEFVAPASAARIASGGFLGDAAAGVWEGANATFAGTPGLGAYEVAFDFSETYGIKGELVFESRAPPHLPCTASLTTQDSPLAILPGLGWTNALPDALVSGSFSLASTPTNTTTYPLTNAAGYHDTNWGSVPFFAAVGSWWWGRARLGPYALVWFHGTSAAGAVFANAYVAHDGAVLLASCARDAANVTAVMGGKDGSVLQAITVALRLPGGQVLRVSVQAANLVVDAPGVYARWLGKVSGGVVGGQKLSGGVGVFERFYPQA